MNEDTRPTNQSDQEDGGEEQPQVFAVSKESNRVKFTRRDFIQVASVTAAGVVLFGCGQVSTPPTSTPTETDTPTEPPTETPTIAPTDTPMPTDTITPSPTPVPMGVVKVATKVRAGGGPSFHLLGYVAKGDQVTILGKSEDGTWLLIANGNGAVGWIEARYVDFSAGSLDALPVATPLPTATPLPGVAGNTSPGNTGINYSYKDGWGNTTTFTLPCGSPIPDGAVCTCNCVTVPRSCSCDFFHPTAAPTLCPCVGNCGCDGDTHYWYPN